jgi:hypothetical protein
MILKNGLYLKQISGGQVCLKERCFDVFLERNKRMGHGKKDTTMNHMKYLMSQTLLIISKLKDQHGQGTWCVWTVIGLLENIQHQTRWSKKCRKTEIAMGGWC